jgi:hypothetical protein
MLLGTGVPKLCRQLVLPFVVPIALLLKLLGSLEDLSRRVLLPYVLAVNLLLLLEGLHRCLLRPSVAPVALVLDRLAGLTRCLVLPPVVPRESLGLERPEELRRRLLSDRLDALSRSLLLTSTLLLSWLLSRLEGLCSRWSAARLGCLELLL